MSTNSLIGGLVGGVAGFFLTGGNPAGAAAGFSMGAGLGAALTPIPGMSQQGPRLSDLKVQTSTYGAAIPRVYGTVGITGNVIWLEGNQLKEVVRRKKVKAGGKGGSKKTTITTYTYYATLAIGLCEGPIAGVRRIWAGPNLIYDAASEDLETVLASNQAADGFTIYRGTADQQPDSRIQADRGVANTPAYRGLAYIVIKDFLLTDYGNAIPAFRVEVIKQASTSPELVGSVASAYTQPSYSTSFMPKPYFISQEKVVFYAPQWDASYPAASSWQACEVRTGGAVRVYSVTTGQTAVPPNGDSSDPSEAWAGAVFSGAGEFSGPDGYTQRRGDLYAGLSNFGGRKLYIGQQGQFGFIQASVASSAGCFAIDNDRVAAIASDGVRIYDIALTLVESHLFAVPAMDYPTARAEWSDGELLLYAGSATQAVYRLDLQACAAELLATLPHVSSDDYYSLSVSLSRGVAVIAEPDHPSRTLRVSWYSMARVGAQAEPLSSVVVSEAELSGVISASDVDASALAATVSGYRVSSTGSIRSALQPLRSAFPFDAVQSGYQLKFVPRGTASVATVDIAELGVDEQLPQSREMDGQLPAHLSVQYLDAARNYDANEQFAQRINTEAVNDSELELAIVMTASQAAQAAERLLSVAWLERISFGPFQLPQTYRHLEPADVITVDAGYAQYELRLPEVSYNADGTLTCSGLPNSAAVYVRAASSDETPSEQTIGLAGESLFVPLDIPVIDETIQDEPGFVGAMTGYTGGWPGAVAMQSVDGGQTWAEIQAYDGKASVGYARGALAANSGSLIDESVLVVDLIGGTLEGVSEAQMLAGTNWAAYGADGRWEIVRFRDAALQADGSYAVSGLKRGDRGTEWATGMHQAGDLFISLDDGDLAAIGMPVESIGVSSTWRGVTAGDTVDSSSDVPFAYRGVNLECLSPVYPDSSRNGSGDLALSWTRRSRLSSSWWATGTAAPLGEASEAYEVDILNGSMVVRTIASNTPSITYTAAQQTSDFGSPQASIATRIYQLSAVVGRGYALEVTA